MPERSTGWLVDPEAAPGMVVCSSSGMFGREIAGCELTAAGAAGVTATAGIDLGAGARLGCDAVNGVGKRTFAELLRCWISSCSIGSTMTEEDSAGGRAGGWVIADRGGVAPSLLDGLCSQLLGHGWP